MFYVKGLPLLNASDDFLDLPIRSIRISKISYRKKVWLCLTL